MTTSNAKTVVDQTSKLLTLRSKIIENDKQMKTMLDQSKTTQKSLHQNLANTYVAAKNLAKNADQLNVFKKHEYWKGRGFPESILTAAMFFVLNAGKGDAAEKRAYNYAKALEEPFKKKIHSKKVIALIEETGGIEALYRRAVAKRQNAKGTPVTPRRPTKKLMKQTYPKRTAITVFVDEKMFKTIETAKIHIICSEGKKLGGWPHFLGQLQDG